MPGGFPLGPEICNGTAIGAVEASTTGTALAGGAANVFGAWTQLIASSPHDACWVVIIVADQGTSNFNAVYNLGIGAAASEKIIAANLMGYGGNGHVYNWYAFPLNIPAGTRIAAQTMGGGGGNSGHMSLQLFDGAFPQIEGAAGVDSVGFVAASSTGTSITTGAANTKSAYVQLTASTPRDYMGFCIALDGLDASVGDHLLIDIAIGAGGSEIVIVPDWLQVLANGGGAPVSAVYMIPIPAGTRIAARAQDDAGAKPFGLTLYGIYQ